MNALVYVEKNYMGFLIHKIWQILKHFSRQLSWAQTSFFWRVAWYVDYYCRCKAELLGKLVWWMTHLRIYFSQMEHCYSHKLYSQCGIYYIYSSSFGDIYPYFFLARWHIYFRFDFGQVFIVLVIGS